MAAVRDRRSRRALAGLGVATVGMLVAGIAPGSATGASGGGSRGVVAATAVRPGVIVRAQAGQLAAAEAAVRAGGGNVGRPLGIINGFAATVPGGSLPALRASQFIAEVSPDAALTMDSVNPTLGYDPTGDDGSLHSIEKSIGAPQAWAAGATGAGVDVAVIDSGVTPVAGLDEPGKVINGPDLSVDAQVPGLASLDGFGHGTHMASIVAGRDDAVTAPAQFNNPSNFVGIAPDAGIVNVRVGSADGAVDVSQVIAGIDWVVQNAKTNGLNVKVLNLSFGTNSVQPYTFDPLDYAAEVAWRHGIVVVASAGNDGSATTSLEDPADDPFVIAVGAENTDTGGVVHGRGPGPGGGPGQGGGPGSAYTVASFSNSGNPDRTVDVLAPGVHVLGLRDPGSYIDQTFPSAEVGTRFFRGSGTSQAAAVVSGAVALLAQHFPDATPDELKYILDATAQPLKGVSSLSQGHGVIQLAKAFTVDQAQLTQMLNGSPKGAPVTPQQKGTSLLNQVVQPWVASTGTGSLDGARGGAYLTDPDGQVLKGPEDVWGGSFDSASMAAAESNSTAWAGSVWNGEQLLGAGAVSTLWDGTAVGGVEPTNMRWANMRWAGDGWDNMRWADSSWDNMRWAGAGWG